MANRRTFLQLISQAPLVGGFFARDALAARKIRDVVLVSELYAAGALAMMPSGLFPERKKWHLGQTALRIVGWGDYQHFGLRISCFGESFLNFGYAGVVGLAVILGILLGSLSYRLNLLSQANPRPCLARNLTAVMFGGITALALVSKFTAILPSGTMRKTCMFL